MEWPFVFRGQLFGEKKKKLKVARLHKNAISANTEEGEEVSQAVVGLVGMGRWMNKWMALEEGWLWVTGFSTNWINKWNNVQWINCSLSLSVFILVVPPSLLRFLIISELFKSKRLIEAMHEKLFFILVLILFLLSCFIYLHIYLSIYFAVHRNTKIYCIFVIYPSRQGIQHDSGSSSTLYNIFLLAHFSLSL